MSKEFKPTLFSMQRDRTVTSTLGHTIHFEKDKPTHVPREMWAAVQEAGAVPVEDLPEDQKKVDNAPIDQAEREMLIFAAFEQMVTANKRGDFTATGTPNRKPLEKIVGFEIDDKERDTMWVKFQQKGND